MASASVDIEALLNGASKPQQNRVKTVLESLDPKDAEKLEQAFRLPNQYTTAALTKVVNAILAANGEAKVGETTVRRFRATLLGES